MQMIYRILLVIILVMMVMIVLLDYIGFQGTIVLNKIGDGIIVTSIDNFISLFEGPQGTSNILYMTIFGACASVGIIAILYKFIKG
jgi:hypothetical protein